MTVLDRATTEKQLAQMVVDYARLRGWMVYRTHDSRHSPAGWPDVVAVRGGLMIAAELKREGQRPTPAQESWLRALARVPGVLTVWWTPSQWELIQATLL